MILKCDLAQIMNAACCSLVPKLQKTMPLCVHPSCGFQQLFKQFDFFLTNARKRLHHGCAAEKSGAKQGWCSSVG